MKGFKSVEAYFENHPEWKEELELIRELTLKIEFEESVKWGAPTYSINGKNVMSIGTYTINTIKDNYGDTKMFRMSRAI